MQVIKRILPLILISLGLLAGYYLMNQRQDKRSSAAAESPSLLIFPSEVTKTANQEFTVVAKLQIPATHRIYGYDLTLKFDPSKLQFVRFVAPTASDQLGTGEVFFHLPDVAANGPGDVILNMSSNANGTVYFDNTAGTVRITDVGSDYSRNGLVYLQKLVFRTTSEIAQTKLTFPTNVTDNCGGMAAMMTEAGVIMDSTVCVNYTPENQLTVNPASATVTKAPPATVAPTSPVVTNTPIPTSPAATVTPVQTASACNQLGSDCMESTPNTSTSQGTIELDKVYFGTVHQLNTDTPWSPDRVDRYSINLNANTPYTLTISGGQSASDSFVPANAYISARLLTLANGYNETVQDAVTSSWISSSDGANVAQSILNFYVPVTGSYEVYISTAMPSNNPISYRLMVKNTPSANSLGDSIVMLANTMILSHYTATDTDSFCSASGILPHIKLTGDLTGSASKVFTGPAGNYNVKVVYYDESDGAAPLTLKVDGVAKFNWTMNQYTNTTEIGNASCVANNGNLKEFVGTEPLALNSSSIISLTSTYTVGEYARVAKIVFTAVVGFDPVIGGHRECQAGVPAKTMGNASNPRTDTCDSEIDMADFESWRHEAMDENAMLSGETRNNWLADFNQDQKVDLLDFEAWRSYYGIRPTFTPRP